MWIYREKVSAIYNHNQPYVAWAQGLQDPVHQTEPFSIISGKK